MSYELQPSNTYNLTDTSRLYLGESLSKNTRLAYRTDLNVFIAWCRIKNRQPLPADPSSVADFISDQASGRLSHFDKGSLTDGKKIRPVTISRRVAALAYAHKANGFDQSPTDNHLVRKVLQGIRRREHVKPEQKKPIVVQTLVDLLAEIDEGTVMGLRDRAFILLGFACAMRRSELVSLNIEDIESTSQGILVHIPFSKTDQEGKGQSVAVLPGTLLCPIRALNRWVKASGITSGYIFRRGFKNDIIDKKDRHITDAYVSKIIKRYAKKAGIDDKALSGHSLRRGFITCAAQRGAHIFKIMSVSRHKSVEMVKKYVEDVEKFQNHAGEGLL